jgi:hypothetical protein
VQKLNGMSHENVTRRTRKTRIIRAKNSSDVTQSRGREKRIAHRMCRRISIAMPG